MIYNDKNGFMTLFLVLILLLVLSFIYWLFRTKTISEPFCSPKYYVEQSNRPPTNLNACSICSGNIDWYVGREGYKKLCPQGQQTSFINTNIYENFDNPPEKQFFEKQVQECKSKGFKPAYNPHVCSEGSGLNRVYDYYRNCKCVDNTGNCTECFKKPDKYGIL